MRYLSTLIIMVIVTYHFTGKIFSSNPSIGFFAHAHKFGNAQKADQIIAPAKTSAEMSQITGNDIINGTLCCIFLIIAAIVLISAIKIWLKIIRKQSYKPLQESPYVEAIR